MSANACPRCSKALSERDQGRATCPFCGAPLKRSATRPLDAPPAADEGYASFQVSPAVEVNGTPPPSPKLAAPGLTPASPSPKSTATGLTPGLTASAKSLRMTMALGGAPALSPPLPVLSPPLPAAPARTAAPAPAVAATAAALAPALTPASRTPAPVPRTPAPPAPPAQRVAQPAVAPPPAPPARGSATVRPLVADSESEPTHVMPPSVAGPAADTNLLADSDLEEPTHVREPGTVTPSLTFPDSEPIASVTLTPDEESPAVSARVLLPVQPRRGLALVGLAMGLAIVGVAVAGVKLLGGRKATPASVTTQAAAAPVEARPVIAAAEPMPAEPPRPAPAPAKAKAVPAAPPPAKAKPVPATPAPTKARAVPATIAHVAAPPRAAAPVEDRRATGRRSGKGHQRQAARARKVAMQAPAAKRNATAAAATTTTTAERGDPRPHYERGNALLFAGDSKGAIAAYREAIRAAPADPSAFRGLGLAYEQQSEPVFAARALRRYLKLAPNAPDREIVARRLERLSHQTKRK